MPENLKQTRNGVTRPTLRSVKCRAVWEYLDDHPALTVADIRAVGKTQGWNEENTKIEFYRWQKFNGLAKSQN